MPRYVILHHTGSPRGDHYDFMLERDGLLKTWIARDPDFSDGRAVESFDHRIEYLEYEGPVSGGRGSVRRVGHGVYEALEWSPGRISILLRDRRITLDCPHPGEGAIWSVRLQVA